MSPIVTDTTRYFIARKANGFSRFVYWMNKRDAEGEHAWTRDAFSAAEHGASFLTLERAQATIEELDLKDVRVVKVNLYPL